MPPFAGIKKRTIYNQINIIYNDLRKYRFTEILGKIQERIKQLTKILSSLEDSIARDNEMYQQQVEKMQHYTRGKLSVEELKNRFGNILERTKEKETKATGIKQTIAQLKSEIAKEEKQQKEREQQQQKREQEELEKEQKSEEKRPAKQASVNVENTENIPEATTAAVEEISVPNEQPLDEKNITEENNFLN